MAVAEYMMVIDHLQLKQVPEFISDRGHWYNPIDHTYIGWIPEVRDYYVPDTIVYLTRQQFIDRCLAIHAAQPLRKNPMEFLDDEENNQLMTNEEVTEIAGTWYDNFVAKNTAS